MKMFDIIGLHPPGRAHVFLECKDCLQQMIVDVDEKAFTEWLEIGDRDPDVYMTELSVEEAHLMKYKCCENCSIRRNTIFEENV
jgi:hypothetical protein